MKPKLNNQLGSKDCLKESMLLWCVTSQKRLRSTGLGDYREWIDVISQTTVFHSLRFLW